MISVFAILKPLTYLIYMIALFAGTSSLAKPTSTYISPNDQYLVVNVLAVGPITDNRKGIYANSLASHLNELIKSDHRFDLYNDLKLPKDLTVDRLVAQPQILKNMGLTKQSVHAVVSLKINRTADRMTYTMRLHSTIDGLTLLERQQTSDEGVDLVHVLPRVTSLYHELVESLPYQGRILSRMGRRVTLNLGSKNGLQPGQKLRAIQIVSLQRHPKFNFIVQSTKQVIGQLSVEKVDPTLSFARIDEEQELNLLDRDTKLETDHFIKYPSTPILGIHQTLTPLSETDQVGEWRPYGQPTFGKVFFGFGFGSNSANLSLADSTTSSLKSSLASNLHLGGELWITPEWTVSMDIKQSVMPSRSSVVSETLNADSLRYSLFSYYNLLFSDNFFGPKIYFGLGGTSLQWNADTTSLFPSLRYSGLALAAGGSFPLMNELNKFSLGTELRYFLNPSVSLDGNNHRMSYLGFYGEFKRSESIRWRALMEVELYASRLGGAYQSFSTSSQNLMIEMHYLF